VISSQRVSHNSQANSLSTETHPRDNSSQDNILLSKVFVVEENSLENCLETFSTHRYSPKLFPLIVFIFSVTISYISSPEKYFST
jgi:hypothetical protein